jgi:predicted nucleic acid-binding protein
VTVLLDANVLIALVIADHVHRGLAGLHSEVVALINPD